MVKVRRRSCGKTATFCHQKTGAAPWEGIASDLAGTALDLFIEKGVHWVTKKNVEAERYYAGEGVKNPKP